MHAVVAHVAHVAHVVAQEMGIQCYHIIAIWRNPDEIDLEGLYLTKQRDHCWPKRDFVFLYIWNLANWHKLGAL